MVSEDCVSKTDHIQMMTRCAEEIEGLRRQIAHLEPKAHAYDQLSAVLALLPRPSQAYGEDLAWRLRSEIKRLTATPQPAAEKEI